MSGDIRAGTELANDEAAVHHELLQMLLDDEGRGERRSLADYQARFVGHEDLVASVFEELDVERSASFEGRERLGPYVLVDELGAGGQGTVFLARDTRLPRLVALKVLATKSDRLGPARLERFRREAAAVSRLDHPGICAVYESGEDDGIHYIAMRHVAGESLAMHVARAASRAGRTSTTVVLP
ncbi:MAG: hypothetical protein KAI24_10435, partial [Planctomycetes bacterium]|nr:hypothetical protein [Planctomycetota bacterium]